jgi:hypothetical protein
VLETELETVLLKRDIKDAFRNVSIVLHNRWLLRFFWKNRYYVKTCLLFDLSIASFIFNLFAKNLKWMIISYLKWKMRHYSNDFIAVFSSNTDLRKHISSYNQLTNVLRLSRNDFKNASRTSIIVFEIKIDTQLDMIRLSDRKLIKTRALINKMLSNLARVVHRARCRWSCISVCEKCPHLATYIKRKRWVITHEHLENKTEKTEKWERYDRVRATHVDAEEKRSRLV